MKTRSLVPNLTFTVWCTFATIAGCALAAPHLAVASSRADAAKPSKQVSRPTSTAENDVVIPGTLRPFLRMAGISQKVTPDEVLPLLARSVVLHGYSSGRPTEFLLLLDRYVHQARELSSLAGPSGTIEVSKCEDAKALLRVIGYRFRPECGQRAAALVTADPERAFLTIDSGFPLPDLEEALEAGHTFTHSFASSHVPVLFTPHEWTSAAKNGEHSDDLIEAIIQDPKLAHLYWGMWQMHAETRDYLQHALGVRKLLPYATTLDMYGSAIVIRSGHMLLPGGSAAEGDWKDLAGASPDAPSEYVIHLLRRDNGWLAAYFDGLSHASEAQLAHFAQAHRVKRFYEGFRSVGISPEAASQTFRAAPALLLLATRLEWEPNGDPHVPGNLQTWGEVIRRNSGSKSVRALAKQANTWQHPDQLAGVMFALSRTDTEFGPLQAFLFTSELDRRRSPENKLSASTVRLLAAKFSEFSNQYWIFSEFPTLTDASIARFLQTAESVGKISEHTLRGNAMGIFEANVGLWQILARQGQIGKSDLNSSWQQVIGPFAKVSSAAQLFDAGRESLTQVVAAAGKANPSQDAIIDLLAGPHQPTVEGQRVHQEVALRIRSVLDGQRLVSLDTLLALGEGLNEMSRGMDARERVTAAAGELREFEMPRPIFTGSERTRWAAGTYNNRHTESEMRTNLTRVISSPSSPAQIANARGQLASFLRDTLVGLNYAYYEPPGSQLLHNNPLFVRSHDFSGDTVIGDERVWQSAELFGEGSPAGGGAHLIGSLADLPYVLAEIEEDFITPQNVQALIWKQFVPTLLANATVPRWWNVTPTELHAVALYQRTGEELLESSCTNQELRPKVLDILADRMMPRKLSLVEQELEQGQAADVLRRVTPSDTFYLAAEFRQRFPGEQDGLGSAGNELDNLARTHPAEVSWNRLSKDFGVAHAVLTQSYAPELVNMKSFPALSGYCSRLMAESWDSNNLYWARLADELGYSPVRLNQLVPQLTERMVEKIFASDLDDWPAVLRAMRETGEEFRQRAVAQGGSNKTVSQP